jgi:hypothetical protein
MIADVALTLPLQSINGTDANGKKFKAKVVYDKA